jgi:hypothetical protein
MPETRRFIWIETPANRAGQAYSYEGSSTLASVKVYVDSLPPNQWVDVVLGVRYSREECLGLQEGIVERLVQPLQHAHELYELVSGLQPASAGV